MRAEPASRELWEDRLRAVAACRARFDVAFEESLAELPGDPTLPACPTSCSAMR